MYSIQKAAEILGKSKSTVRRWMKRFGIKVVEVQTDTKRVYIADDDMNILVDHITQKIASSADKTREYHKHNRNVITTGEGKYYSFAGAASLLGVSVASVKRWSKQDDIEQKLITTDVKRGYISHDDMLRIAELHSRNISPKALIDIDVQRESNATETNMDTLYSIKEVALYLDISYTTARSWIREANIETKTKFMGREVACITYRDVVRLADMHKCEVLPKLSPLSVNEEIKAIKSKLQEIVSEIEDIKHDFRLFVKRSIYIG
jgi:predicted site-specific integrase-resolvase